MNKPLIPGRLSQVQAQEPVKVVLNDSLVHLWQQPRSFIYVTMQITFHIPEFGCKERNLHCDVVHITTVWVSRLVLDSSDPDVAIKAYMPLSLNAIATESEATHPNSGNVYYVTMQITFHIPEFAR